MTQLIVKSDFTPHKAISTNLNDAKKLDSFILEAQQFELKKLMGDAFYLDFMKDFEGSPSLIKYSDLFNGCEFIHCNETIRHEGIKATLCYLSYARYVLNSNVDATASGTVHKITPESEHVDEKTIKRLYDQAYSGAVEYWGDVKKYLNGQDYPLWKKCSTKEISTTNRVSGVSSDDCDYKKGRRYNR